MRLFWSGQAMTLILAFVLFLASTDLVSRRLRRRLQPNTGQAENPRHPQGNSASRHASYRPALRGACYAVVAAALMGSFYFNDFAPDHFGAVHLLGAILR